MSGVALEVQSESLDRLITATTVLASEMSGEDVRRVMGTAMAEDIRSHFADISQDSEHHQSAQSLGAKSTGFYTEARDKTQEPQVVSDGVVISIDQEGLAQRYFGGDIEARPGSFLTIPARGEAYGHRAREFSNLKLVRFPTGIYALVDRDEEPQEGGVYYWLVRSVHQHGDPDILPSEEDLTGAALTSASSYIERVWERQI